MLEFWRGVWHLLVKDLQQELREKYALSGIVLYVLTTTFVIYSVFQAVEPFVWIALFWIITLFAAINAASRSFINDHPQRRLYYYQLVGAGQYIMAKMLFNVLLMLLLTAAANLAFALLLGFAIRGQGLWLALSVLGSVGFALGFTMISAIASKAKNAGVLMTILGLPIIIPQLLWLVKLSKQAVAGATFKASYTELVGLLSMDAIIVAVAMVFFPFLWKD